MNSKSTVATNLNMVHLEPGYYVIMGSSDDDEDWELLTWEGTRFIVAASCANYVAPLPAQIYDRQTALALVGYVVTNACSGGFHFRLQPVNIGTSYDLPEIVQHAANTFPLSIAHTCHIQCVVP